jgi:hypothetical protein
MAQVHAFDFLVKGSQYPRVVVGDEFIFLRGIQREIPSLLFFDVLLGRGVNQIASF